MAIITGVGAAINGQNCSHEWAIEETADLAKYVCATSGGAEASQAGNTDWRGYIAGYGGQPPITPGVDWTFKGTSRDASVYGYEGTAYTELVRVHVEIEAGKPNIWWEANISGNGALDRTPAVIATASGTPNPIVPTSLSMAFDGGGEVADMRKMILTIARPGTPYVSSDTAGATRRTQGNWQGLIQASFYLADPDTMPDVNDIVAVAFDTGGAANWLINWFRVESAKSRMVIEDKQSHHAKNYEGNLVMAFSGWKAGVEGQIKLPDSTFWFGS